MTTAVWREVATRLSSAIAPAGFDVMGAAQVGVYNRTLDEKLSGYRLPELAGERSLVLVLGNTRRMWPLFMRAFRERLRSEEHPVDAYARHELTRAVAEVAGGLNIAGDLRFTFEQAPRAVAVQRLAILTGVAEQSPVGLLVHPEHGPWFSFRAAAIFSTEGPEAQRAPITCSACDTKPCLAAREKVDLATGGVYTRESFDAHWRLWLGMREACPVGTPARFGEQQIRYHYLKRREVLEEGGSATRGDVGIPG
jgi:hypothetical protein